jgi:Icc-related predicted phosphoesterase
MKLFCIPYLHSSATALDCILAEAGSVDLILLGGDITSFGTPEEAANLVCRALATGVPVLAVAGNCDSPQIQRRLEEMDVSLHARGILLEEVGFHGLSASPPWRSHMYCLPEDELQHALQVGYRQIADARRHVVLAHAPPRDGQLDRTFLGRHVGSTALREFIERHQPNLVVCGHVHEARGVESLGRTTVVNCGAASAGWYGVVEIEPEKDVPVRPELRKA